MSQVVFHAHRKERLRQFLARKRKAWKNMIKIWCLSNCCSFLLLNGKILMQIKRKLLVLGVLARWLTGNSIQWKNNMYSRLLLAELLKMKSFNKKKIIIIRKALKLNISDTGSFLHLWLCSEMSYHLYNNTSTPLFKCKTIQTVAGKVI